MGQGRQRIRDSASLRLVSVPFGKDEIAGRQPPEPLPAEATASQPHDGAGHRARLRQRLLDGGPDALLDHELVEYLLGLSIKRQDTKSLAKRLISDFGGFGRLLSADAEAIKRVSDLGESTVAAIEAVIREGGQVVFVVALVDRQEGGRQKIEGLGYSFFSVFTRDELLESGGQ